MAFSESISRLQKIISLILMYKLFDYKEKIYCNCWDKRTNYSIFDS